MARVIFFLFAVFSLTGLFGPGAEAEFYGAAPTGFLQLEKKHPYYLFVPSDYTPERAWPLVVVVGKSGADPEEIVTPWVEWAKKNQFLVLVPSIFPRDGSAPEELNRWLVGIKREAAERYRINPAQVLLVGLDSGASYAAYLGTRFPGEFSAAALIGKGWTGPLESLIQPSSDRGRQIPFYVALDPKASEFAAEEAKALEFERQGYSVRLEPLIEGEEFSKVQERIIGWFRTDLESQALAAKPPKKGFKGILTEIKRNLFED